MITPFDGELALDVDGAVELARWLESEGNEGLVISGRSSLLLADRRGQSTT